MNLLSKQFAQLGYRAFEERKILSIKLKLFLIDKRFVIRSASRYSQNAYKSTSIYVLHRKSMMLRFK